MSRYRSVATRRYLRRMVVLMTLYIGLIFMAGYVFRHLSPPAPLSYLIAIAPALPIIGVFWAVMRLLVEEPDEYMRMLHVRQCLFATGFCLTVMTVWEFLQNYEVVAPGNHGFGAAFFWFMGLGLGAAWNRFATGAGTCA